jgi:hypothetical protein
VAEEPAPPTFKTGATCRFAELFSPVCVCMSNNTAAAAIYGAQHASTDPRDMSDSGRPVTELPEKVAQCLKQEIVASQTRAGAEEHSSAGRASAGDAAWDEQVKQWHKEHVTDDPNPDPHYQPTR